MFPLADPQPLDDARLVAKAVTRAGGGNLAVLRCRAFAQPRPVDGQSWHLYLMRERVVLTNETLRQMYEMGWRKWAFVRAQESG